MTIFAENFDVYSFLLDFAFASGFVLLGQLIRSKIKFFQYYFVPASLIAGFLGLASALAESAGFPSPASSEATPVC